MIAIGEKEANEYKNWGKRAESHRTTSVFLHDRTPPTIVPAIASMKSTKQIPARPEAGSRDDYSSSGIRLEPITLRVGAQPRESIAAGDVSYSTM